MKLATAAGLLRSGEAGVLLSLQRLLKPYYRVCFLGAATGSGKPFSSSGPTAANSNP